MRPGCVRGSLLFAARVGLPLTPPTRCPHGWGQCAWSGIASIPVGITRQRFRESRTPLQPRCDDSCESHPPGPDDPSEPTWLGLRGHSRELIALAVPTPTAAPLRLLRPGVRGPMRRELHERFMPECSRTGNKLNTAQSLLLSTELSTASGHQQSLEITARLVFKRRSLRKIPGGVPSCGEQ